MSEIDRAVEVLALHWRKASGMTYGTPDGCACGAKTLPVEGDEDVSERRARAFARHQAEMLHDSGIGNPATDEAAFESAINLAYNNGYDDGHDAGKESRENGSH